MEYKTTYFKLSINNEISVLSEEYNYRMDKDKLIKEIASCEKFLNGRIPTDFNIYDNESNKRINFSLYKQYNNSYQGHFDELVKLKKYLDNIDNKRFTDEDEVAFNKHLNEIASEGWKLQSTQPIIKGYKDFQFSRMSESSYGYGYGHDVIEGFVLIWEKE